MATAEENKRVYHTVRWRKLRKVVLSRDGFLCRCDECQAHGFTRPAEVIHHKQPWQHVAESEQEELIWSVGNLIAVSRHCHARLHAQTNKDESEKPAFENDWDRLVADMQEN